MKGLMRNTEVLDFFEDVFNTVLPLKVNTALSFVDDDGFQVFTVDMPGVSSDDVLVEYDSADGCLYVEGSRQGSAHTYKATLFPFDGAVDPAQAQASVVNGVLTVKVPPKEVKEAKRKQIPVQT